MIMLFFIFFALYANNPDNTLNIIDTIVTNVFIAVDDKLIFMYIIKMCLEQLVLLLIY